jgi:hypothetical protein
MIHTQMAHIQLQRQYRKSWAGIEGQFSLDLRHTTLVDAAKAVWM